MLKIELGEGLISSLSESAQKSIRAAAPSFLESLGVLLLSEIRLAYQEKASGQVGSDGIKWKPLAKSTIQAKNRKAKPARKQKGRPKAANGISLGASEIGVDKGLQRASATPGFRGSDGQGGNVLDISLPENQVTVGFGRSYSEYFDEVRPLIPEKLPQAWIEAAEELIVDAYTDAIERAFT